MSCRTCSGIQWQGDKSLPRGMRVILPLSFPRRGLSKNYRVVVIPLLWAADVLVCPLTTLDRSFKRADREVCRAQYCGFLEGSLRGNDMQHRETAFLALVPSFSTACLNMIEQQVLQKTITDRDNDPMKSPRTVQSHIHKPQLVAYRAPVVLADGSRFASDLFLQHYPFSVSTKPGELQRGHQ